MSMEDGEAEAVYGLVSFITDGRVRWTEAEMAPLVRLFTAANEGAKIRFGLRKSERLGLTQGWTFMKRDTQGWGWTFVAWKNTWECSSIGEDSTDALAQKLRADDYHYYLDPSSTEEEPRPYAGRVTIA